jgi:hypothetical protein
MLRQTERDALGRSGSVQIRRDAYSKNSGALVGCRLDRVATPKVAIGGVHGTTNSDPADIATVAPGAPTTGAVREVMASHEAMCEASGPLPDGSCDSADVVKGV